MTKDEVYDVVKKHLTEICEDIPADTVEPNASMKDLGASSLDIVEVVSCSMRELRVRVPRAELADITDIGGLSELLHRALEEKKSA